jgi:Hpt domain
MENPAMQIPALDLGHLDAQTLGDAALEQQLLTLFRVQARQILSDLQNGRFDSPQMNADFAHLLRGSALAIGATRVAAMAGAYENLAASPHDGPIAIVLEALAKAVADALAAIDRRIGP